jgi:hypothetical protein
MISYCSKIFTKLVDLINERGFRVGGTIEIIFLKNNNKELCAVNLYSVKK